MKPRTWRTALLALLALGVALSVATAAPSTHARCFGAASHDPLHPCTNPALELTVIPSVSNGPLEPSSPCYIVRTTHPEVCSFGVSGHFHRWVALLGDSHSVHWRAALDVVAHQRGWHGDSLSQSNCAFTMAVNREPGYRRPLCARWKKDVVAWFRSHPGVSTVLVSEHHGGSYPAAPGKTLRQTLIDGYEAAWRALPSTVTKIVVIRDTPYVSGDWQGCITRALQARRPPGPACREPRSRAVHEDVAAEAARQLKSPRVSVVDLTPFFCDAAYCDPVIGGALVHKDHGHITTTYSTSMGPYLGRELDQVLAGGAS